MFIAANFKFNGPYCMQSDLLGYNLRHHARVDLTYHPSSSIIIMIIIIIIIISIYIYSAK